MGDNEGLGLTGAEAVADEDIGEGRHPQRGRRTSRLGRRVRGCDRYRGAGAGVPRGLEGQADDGLVRLVRRGQAGDLGPDAPAQRGPVLRAAGLGLQRGQQRGAGRTPAGRRQRGVRAQAP